MDQRHKRLVDTSCLGAAVVAHTTTEDHDQKCELHYDLSGHHSGDLIRGLSGDLSRDLSRGLSAGDSMRLQAASCGPGCSNVGRPAGARVPRTREARGLADCSERTRYLWRPIGGGEGGWLTSAGYTPRREHFRADSR